MLTRSITLTGLALATTLGLAACGNNEPEAPAAPVDTTANDPLNPATTAPASDPTTKSRRVSRPLACR